MQSICGEKKCAGCMACVDVCPTHAIVVKTGNDFYSPVIDCERCIDCGSCVKVCQQLHPSGFREPTVWYQGWADEPRERELSTSGGFATTIERAFAASGGSVCACAFSGGRFGFEVVDEPDKVDRFRGSKYVKSDTSGTYNKVKALLKDGHKVLFIGLPCQVSAMRNFIGERLEGRLYTIDLICHGTPSPQLLELFLHERGHELGNLKGIAFRCKAESQLSSDAVTTDVPGVVDSYLNAFHEGLSYTENCYSCVYARRERVSDLTLGDSWGSELADEMARGVSLALCQTSKGEELLHTAGIKLLPVDAERAAANNPQLNRPMRRHRNRKRFLSDLASGVPFDCAVRRALPSRCFRQGVKRVLLRLGLLNFTGGYQITLFHGAVSPCSESLHGD